MRDVGTPESGRLEQILERVDFFKPVATRRGFMQKLLLAGGAAAAGAAGLSKVMPARRSGRLPRYDVESRRETKA